MEVQGTELLYEGLALQLGFESRPTLEQFHEHVWPVIDTIVRVRWDLTPVVDESSGMRAGSMAPILGLFPPASFYVLPRSPDVYLVVACDFDWDYEWVNQYNH